MVSASSQVISQVVISPKAAHLCAISNCRHNRWVLGRHEEGLDASCKGRTKAEDGRRGRGRMSGDNSTKATHEARLLRKALRLPYTSLLPRQPSATKLSQKRLCQVYWSNGCYTGCSQNRKKKHCLKCLKHTTAQMDRLAPEADKHNAQINIGFDDGSVRYGSVCTPSMCIDGRYYTTAEGFIPRPAAPRVGEGCASSAETCCSRVATCGSIGDTIQHMTASSGWSR